MDAMTVVYIVIAIVLGAGISFFLTKNKEKSSENETGSAQAELVKDYEQKLKDSECNADELKEKYEDLLAQANEQISVLNSQLKQAVEGHLDEAVKKQLEGVEKLKKEIKSLEDEIEDYEDDIKDLKKKMKNKESENLALQDSLSKEQRICKQLYQDIQIVKNDLEEKSKDLALKVESLAFMQEILTAKQVSDSSTKELHGQVDAIVDYISGELKDNFKTFLPNDEDNIFGVDLQRWAIATKKTWIQGKTTIAFVGEFSAGKTSIVNRILSQDNPNVPLLPVSTKATTAIPTYISGGPSTLYQFVSPDNKQKVISEKTFKKINKEVLDQVKGVSSLIQYFVMKYKNPNLDKISLLDTPGFNSNDKEDAERTIEVINECDALFWVFDVNAGTVNRSSISLIKNNLKKPLYVIINKVDTKAESEVNSVEQLIRKTLKDEGVSVEKFIRFSIKTPLSNIMQPILSVTHSTEQESYLTNLSSKISKVVNKQNESVNLLNRNHLALIKEGDKLVDQYIYALNDVRNKCEEAADIPQWTEHLFSKDRYEMSQSQGNRLINLLQMIYDDCANNLCDLYDSQMEIQRKAQQAYSDFSDQKMKWQDLNNCKEQFNKLAKPFLRR